jgi:hypothetical protein
MLISPPIWRTIRRKGGGRGGVPDRPTAAEQRAGSAFAIKTLLCVRIFNCTVGFQPRAVGLVLQPASGGDDLALFSRSLDAAATVLMCGPHAGGDSATMPY